jgi:hypothetical protein
VRHFLEYLGQSHQQVILFGEVYGSKIQLFHYGYKGTLGYRAFDLFMDGRYVDWPDFVALCQQFDVEIISVVAAIPLMIHKGKHIWARRFLWSVWTRIAGAFQWATIPRCMFPAWYMPTMN